MSRAPTWAALALVLGGVVALSAAVSAAPQEPWDFGPCLVGRRTVAFEHAVSSSPTGKIYGSVWYPALADGMNAPPSLEGAPYPHLVFFHGYTAPSGSYSGLLRQVVSNGFVVSAVETNLGVRGEDSMHEGFAHDQKLFVDHIEREAREPGSFWHGMIDGGDLGVFGHSFGASALFFYLPLEPRARVALALQPYAGPYYGGIERGLAFVPSYEGSLVVLSGLEDDVTNPWRQNLRWFDAARSAAWKLWVLVEGMGHLGPLDSPPAPQSASLPMEEQLRAHRFFVAALFRATLRSEEGMLARLLDPPALGLSFTRVLEPALVLELAEAPSPAALTFPMTLPSAFMSTLLAACGSPTARPSAARPPIPLAPGYDMVLRRVAIGSQGRARAGDAEVQSLSFGTGETTIERP